MLLFNSLDDGILYHTMLQHVDSQRRSNLSLAINVVKVIVDILKSTVENIPASHANRTYHFIPGLEP